MVIVWWGLVERPSHWRDIDVDNFLGIRIVDWAEIEWICVLAVIDVRAIVHERLLEANIGAKTLIVANCPCYLTLVRGFRIA